MPSKQLYLLFLCTSLLLHYYSLSMEKPDKKSPIASKNTNKFTPEELAQQKKRRDQDKAIRAVRIVQGLSLRPEEKSFIGETKTLYEAQTEHDVEMLIATGHVVNRHNQQGYTPIHTAKNRAVLEAFMRLCGLPIVALKTLHTKQTGLHTAATAEVALFFLDHGIPPLLQDSDNNTPFHTARDHTITETLYNYLVDKKITQDLSFLNKLKNKHGRNPLQCARTAQQATFLIRHGVDPHIPVIEPMNVDNDSNEQKVALVIIKAKKLKDAILKNNWQAIEDLLLEGTAVDKALINQADLGGNTLLHRAAARDNCALVELLIKAGADITIKNSLRKTALHYAQSPAILKALINAGANPIEPDEAGNIPLHSISSLECAKVLLGLDTDATNKKEKELDCPTDPNAQNDQGQTPLCTYICACSRLQENLAQINLRDRERRSKLSANLAMYHDLIRYFINKLKVDIHVTDKDKNGPLHLARELKIVKILITAGARINEKNLAGHTPLTLAAVAFADPNTPSAIQEQQRQIITCLLEHGAKLRPISPRGEKNTLVNIKRENSRNRPSNNDTSSSSELIKDDQNDRMAVADGIPRQLQIPVLPNLELLHTSTLENRDGISARATEVLMVLMQTTPKTPQECFDCWKNLFQEHKP